VIVLAETKTPLIEKEAFDGSKVKILGETYEPGKPEQPGIWRNKFQNRDEMLKYLSYGERYWSEGEGYGSEKRKTPA
jgi:hypothetical protein